MGKGVGRGVGWWGGSFEECGEGYRVPYIGKDIGYGKGMGKGIKWWGKGIKWWGKCIGWWGECIGCYIQERI